jgi:F-type H+-transporting ATPase subunit d
MAARVSTSVVDLAALAGKIPSNQMASFNALRGKVEKHLRNVNALPAALPNIDFAAYNKVTVPGMVEGFEKKYKALEIPYPSDQGALQAIDTQAKEQEAAYKQFCADSVKNIAGIKTELAKWEAMKPVEEMNLEEALDAGLVGTTIKGMPNPDVPSFWPHDESWEEYMERLKNAEDDSH